MVSLAGLVLAQEGEYRQPCLHQVPRPAPLQHPAGILPPHSHTAHRQLHTGTKGNGYYITNIVFEQASVSLAV